MFNRMVSKSLESRFNFMMNNDQYITIFDYKPISCHIVDKAVYDDTYLYDNREPMNLGSSDTASLN